MIINNTTKNSLLTEDGKVIRKLQAGDLTALGELYDRHKICTYRTALAITHDPIAADDILQDCFLRLYKYADSIDPTRPLKPWLYRVTVNLAKTWAKRRSRWLHPLEDVQEKLVNPNRESPEKRTERNEREDEIINALASLNIQHRTVIALYYLNALSMDEIATILECPLGTVKSRLFYGRQKLRTVMSQNQSEFSGMEYEYA